MKYWLRCNALAVSVAVIAYVAQLLHVQFEFLSGDPFVYAFEIYWIFMAFYTLFSLALPLGKAMVRERKNSLGSVTDGYLIFMTFMAFVLSAIGPFSAVLFGDFVGNKSRKGAAVKFWLFNATAIPLASVFTIISGGTLLYGIAAYWVMGMTYMVISLVWSALMDNSKQRGSFSIWNFFWGMGIIIFAPLVMFAIRDDRREKNWRPEIEMRKRFPAG